jgi:hypothetical protein
MVAHARASTAPHASPAAAEPLRVAVVGGLTRATWEWEQAGEDAGIVVEHHDGRTHGARASTLAEMVRRADVVVTITIPNSHNAVSIARRIANANGRVFRLVKRLRPNGLAALVAEAVAAPHGAR